MKKIFIVVFVLLFVTACGGEADLIGTWISSDNSTYQFNEDGTCEKRTNINKYSCTYTKNGGVVDINLSDGTIESGQINPDRIVIGSDVYKKGE
ncbi:MAG: hypothetical protein IJO43_03965 [Bacilli bacterium]|nr:hypothetical protein [Bacilli bacterium]